ncbi:WYL domain-containing protein [Halalkalibacter hemicellulosilyticus]|uniref:WYL domain-containing protein n=1 Tax=Halalkalibacter hemicellulosilyticusJCM 9152 TaxID=1236971 RepID=W4QMB6_9BACI|nr:hypothetical protein JCM9152_3999 [Halalkalibacter hemicellulosilyticusJCM 9152]
MKGLLQRAAQSKEKVQIVYLTDEGKMSQRYVSVIKVNETHLVCYCHYKKQRRMFKLENILAADVYRKRAKAF